MVIFHSYVSLPEGMGGISWDSSRSSDWGNLVFFSYHARGYGTSFHSAVAFGVQSSDGNVFVIGLAKL